MSVSDSGDGCTPVNNGTANLAVSTTCITIFCSCRCFVRKSGYGMLVPRTVYFDTGKFCCNANAAAERTCGIVCICNSTAECSYINKYFRFTISVESLCLCHVGCLGTVSADIGIYVKLPNTNGYAYQSLLACKSCITRLCNGYSCNL